MGIAVCCARAASGHAAPPPMSAMNWRRLMGLTEKDHGLSIASSECQWRASQQNAHLMSESGLVSRGTPVQTALRNCTRDEGRSFEVGNQVLISSHRKLLLSKAMVVNVAETSGLDSDRQG